MAKNKKFKKILLPILVICVVLAGLVWWQWDKIELLKYYNMDKAAIGKELEANEEAEKAIRGKYGVPDIDLTDDEKEALKDGTTTADAVAEKILNNSAGNNQNSASAGTSKNEQIQKLLAQLYILQGTYSSSVDSVIEQCKAEYHSLEPAQQTKANKAKIVSKNIGVLSSMESQCDGQVATIVSQISSLDSSLAKQIQAQYESAKAAKKAEVLNRYS